MINIKPTDHMIQTLKLIQGARHTSAIIAGGAIRDNYHDVMISDVDVFIQHPSFVQTGEARADCMPQRPFQHAEWNDYWAEVLQLRSDNERLIVSDRVTWHYSTYEEPPTKRNPYVEDDDFSKTPDVLAVWNIMRGFNPYQIIFTTMDPVQYVNDKFDFGLCKAYCDGYKVHLSQDFMTDTRNKTITFVGNGLTNQQTQYALSHHLPRIQEKYPGYQLIVPLKQ